MGRTTKQKEEEPVQGAETPKKFDASGYEPESVSVSTEYWDFENNPEFIGTFEEDFYGKRKDDEDEEEQIMGYVFKEFGDEQYWILPNVHAINKALDDSTNKSGKPLKESGALIGFEFLGKGTKSDGLPYSKFKITAYWPRT